MEEHERHGFSPAQEQYDTGPSPVAPAPPFKSPAGALYTIPASPARSRSTVQIQEELNEAGGSVPDYAAMVENPFRQPSRQPSKMGSVVGDQAANEVCQHMHSVQILTYKLIQAKSPRQAKSPHNRHLSYESWGNIGPPRESTFGPMLVKVALFSF
jgi:hypothetical protein